MGNKSNIQFYNKYNFYSNSAGIELCYNIVTHYRALMSFDKSVLFAFKTIVLEAVTNAIVHGNRNNENLLVQLTIFVKDTFLIIIVEDQGDGFDFKAVYNPTDTNNLKTESGRGLFFIKKLSHKVEFAKKGRVLTSYIKLE